jgi:hypothetical protein
MATNNVFARIKEIIDSAPASTVSFAPVWYQALAMPLLRCLSHHAVTSSLILEIPLDKIHNLMYGTGGSRGGQFMHALTSIFVSMAASGGQPDQLDMLDDLTAMLTVLRRIVDLNLTAKVQDQILHSARTLDDYLSTQDLENPKAANCQRILRRILKNLDQGLNIPEASPEGTNDIESRPTFDLGVDLPGAGREGGPRHDNDHHEISRIGIMPTSDELASQHAEYRPTNNPQSWHLPGIQGLLDRQFRLLREDTVGQLRDAVKFQIQELRRARNRSPVHQSKAKGSRVMIYHDLRFDSVLYGRDHLALQVSFEQAPSLITKSKSERRAWWEASRGLQQDALVCAIGPSGFAMFMSICNDPRVDRSNDYGSGYKNVYFDDPHRAATFVKLIEPNEFSFRHAESCLKAQGKQRLILCEFPGVLLPAFWYTLEALKKMSQNPTMPFTDLIAPAANPVDADSLSRPPEYTKIPGFHFDMAPIIDANTTLHLIPGVQFDHAALHSHSTLDDAQQVALVAGLSNRFALIQGKEAQASISIISS